MIFRHYRRFLQAELRAIEEALELTRGHRLASAKLLGMDVARLKSAIHYHASLQKWRLPRPGRPYDREFSWLRHPPQPAKTLRGWHTDLDSLRTVVPEDAQFAAEYDHFRKILLPALKRSFTSSGAAAWA
jgi:hypothetical protein